ncbi:MAG: hypothetical protein D6721_07960 [Gammaproteobacteria bacterium]|nr:MAG: hypothetical protein D6721_07960 [Gammaproteobacteria bacterium]
MPVLSSPGLGSGLDVKSLVQSLVQAEGAPAKQRLDRRETDITTKITALGKIKGAFSDLADAIHKLADPALFQSRSFTSSDESVLTGSAGTTAATGTYAITVDHLAQSQALVTQTTYTSPTDVVGEGTITITFGSNPTGSFTPNPDKQPVTINIDATNHTLEGVRDAINAADAGVRASIVNTGSGYVLTLNAVDTGAANAMKIDVTEGSVLGLSALAYNATTQNLTQTRQALDAQVSIDGVTVTHPTNTLDQAIDGLTLKLAGPGSTTVRVRMDRGAMEKAIDNLVKAYNAFHDTVHSLTAYDPKTTQAGPLNGDAGVRTLANAVRRLLGTRVEGLDGGLNTLADVGVSIDADGKMTFDQAKFESALAAHPDAVQQLFSGKGTPGQSGYVAGIATGLDDYFTQVQKDDLLGARMDALNDRAKEITKERERLDRHLQDYQKRLMKQFTALDMLISQLQATSARLQQQLASLPAIQVKTGQ